MFNRKIVEYLEKKYNVDLSRVKFIRKTFTISSYYSWYENEIVISKPIRDFLMGVCSVFLGGALILYGVPNLPILPLYTGLGELLHSFSSECDIAHEYAHASWVERVRKFKKSYYPYTKEEHDMMEAHAIYEENNNPHVSKTKRAVQKSLYILMPTILFLPFSCRRKYLKFFNLIEKINPEKPALKPISEIVEKVDENKLYRKDKKILKNLFREEYKKIEKDGLKEWIENSPAILPEKSHLIKKLVKYL
jgi:hypothetical protein